MGFDKLSDEILLRIFSYLDTQNIFSCYFVSKRFYRVSQDPSLFSTFNVCSDIPLSSRIVHTYTSKYSRHIHKLTLKDCFWIAPSKLLSSLQLCKELKELNVTGARLTLPGLVKIFANNKNITKLKWLLPSSNSSHIFTTASVKEIQDVFSKLSSLILHFETLRSFEQFLPVFNKDNIFVNEFGLHYLKSSASNTYGVYIKTTKPFQLYLEEVAVRTRFLHFNLLVMDFVIQAVSKAADTKCITSLLARNTICWKHVAAVLNTYSFEEIDLSLSALGKEQITWLSKLTGLKHLNLSQVGQFKANLMKAIAVNCSNLESLNLSYCEHWINKDLHGLEALSNYCPHLKELNLACLHIHSSNHQSMNRLCSLISRLKSLKALSLPACALVNNVENGSEKDGKISPHVLLKSSNYKSKTVSNLLISVDASSTTSHLQTSLDGYATRLSHVTNDEHVSGTGLENIVKNCYLLEELEIIDTGFRSAFSRVVIDKFICPLTSRLYDNCFAEITTLKNLKRLTVAGLSSAGAFNSLTLITSSCELLEFLSIAHCGLAGHSNALISLKSALTFCKNLRHLRLDQPYFTVKEDILESLHICKRIQSVTFILKNGKISKDINCYLNLFLQCPRLVAFFLFSGATSSDCKKIQNCICKRFSKLRPSLSASVLPYNTALTEEGLKNIPHLYQRNFIQFESRVAVCRKDQ